MKRHGKLVKVLSGSLSTSIIASSCNLPGTVNYLMSDADDNVYNKVITRASEIGLSAVPMDMCLESADVRYLEFLSDLGEKIIKDPKVAHDFSHDPQKYIEEQGYSDIQVNLDESILNLVVALGDNEVLETINNNDFEGFIEVCQKKNLLQYPEMFSKEVYKEQLKKINEAYYNGTLNIDDIEDEMLVSPVVVMVVMVVVGFGIFVAVGMAFMFASPTKGLNTVARLLPEKEAILEVWALKDDGTKVIVNPETQEQITVCLDYIKQKTKVPISEDIAETLVNNASVNSLKILKVNEE